MPVVLARLATDEIAAIAGGAVFVAILAFLLFWGGLPSGDSERTNPVEEL